MLEFKSGVCRILGNNRELIAIGKQTRDNLFHLNTNVNDCLVVKIEDNWLSHKRFCHANFDNLIKVSKSSIVRGLPHLVKLDNVLCKDCQMGNMASVSFKSKSFSLENILDLVHTNLCGSMRTNSYFGDKYFMIFTDDYSKMMWVTFLRENSEAFSKFKAFKALVEKDTRKNLKCLRFDWGGKFTFDEFVKFCDEQEIKRRMLAPRTPKQNRIAKRINRTVVEATRTILIQGELPKIFWRVVVNTVVYTLNRVFVKKGNTKTPYEL